MRPVIVSYYTKGTGYETEARRLRASLKALGPGLELYDIRGIDNLGNWMKNTHRKASIIKEAMDRYQLPVLFIDADAVVHKYPDLFDIIQEDIAVHYHAGHQLNSAVIFFNKTINAENLLNAWIERNRKQPQTLEQQNLQDLIESHPWNTEISIYKLPPEYAKIFDLMPEVQDPVIELFQASRRLRDDVRISLTEKEKYCRQWKTNYMPSVSARVLADYINSFVHYPYRLLDIGCGDGTTVVELRKKGWLCDGMDITLAGLKPEAVKGFYESTLWAMPFNDREFGFTFSTDVLEHIPPEKIEDAIKEIFRISRHRTLHIIATFPHEMDGVDLHLTVKPISWWQEQFDKFNPGIQVELIDRIDFLKRMKDGSLCKI